MFFQAEFPSPIQVRKITLDTRPSRRDWPQTYEVMVSEDGSTWTQPLFKGLGSSPMTQIRITPLIAKVIRVTQTGTKPGLFCSIHELTIE